MGTTLVIVELLVIGFQVLVWVGLLTWPLISSHLEQLKDFKELLTIGAIAAAYTFGLVFDRSIGLCTSRMQSSRLLGRLRKDWASTDSTSRWQEYIKCRVKCILDRILKPEKNGNGQDDRRENSWELRKQGKSDAVRLIDDLDRQKRLLRATCLNAFLIAAVARIRWSLGGWVVVLLLLAGLGAFLAWLDLDRRIRGKWQDI